MLMGTVPVYLRSGLYLKPSDAGGNDSYTKSLLHFDFPEAFANTPFFVDDAFGAPQRKQAWTVAQGSPRAQYRDPWGQGCGYFNGVSAIQCPDAADFTPNGDFCIDFWYAPAVNNNLGDIVAKRASSLTPSPYTFIENANQINFYSSAEGDAAGQSSIANGLPFGGTFVVGDFNHVAVSRAGTTWRMFYGGAVVQTWNSSLPLFKNSDPLRIGGFPGVNCNGFVNEFRFTRGVPRWTAPFTPPNQQYYSYLNTRGNDEVTRLLMHFDNNYDDANVGSLNGAHAFVKYGGIMFAGGGSAALKDTVLSPNGPGNRIASAPSHDFDFGRGNFCIDFWLYRYGGANGDYIARRATNADIAPFIIYDSGGPQGPLIALLSYAGTAWDVATFSFTVSQNIWEHFALQRVNNMLLASLDGALVGSIDIGLNSLWDNNGILTIGGNTTESPAAFIEEMRVSSVARWPTGNFTPPTVPYAEGRA